MDNKKGGGDVRFFFLYLSSFRVVYLALVLSLHGVGVRPRW